MSSIRAWLETAREQRQVPFLEFSPKVGLLADIVFVYSYTMLGYLMQLEQPFFMLPGILPSLKSALFDQASGIANRHWRSLIALTMKPLVSHCSPQFSLEDILAPFFDYLDRKLVAEWQRLKDGSRVLIGEQ